MKSQEYLILGFEAGEEIQAGDLVKVAPEEKDYYECPHCPKITPTLQGMKSHVGRMHKDEATFVPKMVVVRVKE